MNTLRPGSTGSASVRVTQANTAAALGNQGVDVFATPFMAALVEEACRVAALPLLQPGSLTLGGSLELRHLAPTPIGFTVIATATLTEVKGPKLVFEVSVSDEVEKVGEARHVRFVARADDFHAKVRAKAAGRPGR